MCVRVGGVLTACRHTVTRLARRSVTSSSSSPSSVTAAAVTMSDTSSDAVSEPPTSVATVSQKTSKAMHIYKQLARKHEEFMKKQLAEYNIGRRHLANMMGEDPEHFTQQDIDRSIRYLFPSGIFDKKARPQMKHPDDVFPKQKEVKFDDFGRPFHSMFYTLRPQLNETLHTLATKFDSLNKMYNKMQARGHSVDESKTIVLLGSEWLDRENLSLKMMESLSVEQYERFVQNLNRLASHPLSYHEKDFIFSFRTVLSSKIEESTIPELIFDEAGRPYVEAAARRKHFNAHVTVRGRGSGQVTINGQPAVSYFLQPGVRSGILEMFQLMYPLQLTDTLDSVDVEASVWPDESVVENKGGATVVNKEGAEIDPHGRPLALIAGTAASSQAGAVRLATSLALRSFVDTDMIETMRIAGLLTHDPRRHERKKTGKLGARRARTYKKR